MDDLDGWQTAVMLRALLPAPALPIVFVSANLFDHQPEQLEAAQCQGFVAKPVIESELLDTLEMALQLEWIRDNTPLPLAGQPQIEPYDMAPDPGDLPDSLREELVRLAHLGQATTIRELLRKAHDELPDHKVTLDLLQVCANRFDFQALASHLRASDYDTIC